MRLIPAATLLSFCLSASAEYYPLPEYNVYGSPASPADGAAIDALLQEFQQAWADQDATAVAALHAHDAEWTNAFGRTFRGADALRAFLADNLFPNYPAQVAQAEMDTFGYLSRRYLGNDAAVIHAYTSSRRGSAVTGDERRIFFDFVLEKQAGEWKIVHQTIADIRERRD